MKKSQRVHIWLGIDSCQVDTGFRNFIGDLKSRDFLIKFRKILNPYKLFVKSDMACNFSFSFPIRAK